MSAKGKGKADAIDLNASSDSDSEDFDDSSSSSSQVSSDREDDEEEMITQEYLDSLLEKARQNAALLEEKEKEEARTQQDKEDVLTLEKIDSQPPLPPLNPGILPPSYFNFTSGSSSQAEIKTQDHSEPSSSGILNSLSRDPLAEIAESALAKAASTASSPLEFHDGKDLTKKQRKEVSSITCSQDFSYLTLSSFLLCSTYSTSSITQLKPKTAGPDWFDLPAPSESDLPRLYREVEALRLRNQLDPKRFYRKEEGEGKGIKGLPKHFAIGKIITTDTPFGGASGDNLTRAERKRTLVDELVDDAEMKRYAKRKFEDFQKVRGVRGKNTKNVRKQKPKW
ncbi:Fcf2 pre-rRNA processing-domain-containing protein [Lentinula detonsa]|uniref:Fcf2 pre-rRNA processing-domain-containing protein n=1 Tax=Lentinula detonsa TaxID=2804962 RepID=A0A9W8U0C6_9AGAR|nr:Fcf2 pre-rRNA processing-domain-containing protein [Lentinula detonsa]